MAGSFLEGSKPHFPIIRKEHVHFLLTLPTSSLAGNLFRSRTLSIPSLLVSTPFRLSLWYIHRFAQIFAEAANARAVEPAKANEKGVAREKFRQEADADARPTIPEASSAAKQDKDSDIDYDAIEAELAAQEATEDARDAEYRKRKEAGRESNKGGERARRKKVTRRI
jgi:hypothetical protein